MNKTKILLPGFLLLLCAPLFAQEGGLDRTIELGAVNVVAQRPLEDIGMQITRLDSVTMRDNITNSMAEVLSLGSSIFIKSYGRATLATASFRGTAPSHTQVLWNGLKLNSPMLGMVDFSLIPSYFIDDADLYAGASSVGMAGGGLGGAVVLGNRPGREEGPGVRYIQGIGSFDTYDEFLRVDYGRGRWNFSTRVLYSSSDNDFEYTNYNKYKLVKDDNGQITGKYYGTFRNLNGRFRDFHALQEVYYDAGRGHRFSLSAWYLDSQRGVPALSTERDQSSYYKTGQDERTLRTVAGWDMDSGRLDMSAKAGYAYTDLGYFYEKEIGATGIIVRPIDSRSYVSTLFGMFDTEYRLGKKWLFSVDLTAYRYSADSRNMVLNYQAASESRTELSVLAAVRYKPTERLGLAVNLREEHYDDFTPLIPAGFFEYQLSRNGRVLLKASASRNYRYPTLNDLYFKPGGNPGLKPERGFTYDGGVELRQGEGRVRFGGEVTGFDSYIDDWILWRPGNGGIWTPINVEEVHSYGLETRARVAADLRKDLSLMLNGNYTYTHAINNGEPMSAQDKAVGKQLVYIPRHSAAAIGALKWRTWAFTYKWNYYSERFTTSSNDRNMKIGLLPAYFMSDVSLEKRQDFKWARVGVKLAVNNLFDEEYESVLSRPMAGRNFGLYIELTPVFRKR